MSTGQNIENSLKEFAIDMTRDVKCEGAWRLVPLVVAGGER
jgi:hypothetical protein